MFIDHVVAKKTSRTGPVGYPTPGKMYEFVYAANGVFIRAQRQGMAAQIPIVLYPGKKLPGLMSAGLVVALETKIPLSILDFMIRTSRENIHSEMLFYLGYFNEKWSYYIPPQVATAARCQPVNPYGPGAMIGMVDVHSHNTMDAFFSREDDRDETGFRLYVVLGRLDKAWPHILCRVGIYGHHAVVPASMIFQDFEKSGAHDVYTELC